jgi:integrase
MAKHLLTAKRVEAITKSGRHADGGNLYLEVSAKGTKSWTFLYMVQGRSRQMGLGSLRRVSLKLAREKADECHELLGKGVDPIDHRRASRASADTPTFKECAEKLIRSKEAGWRNEKHISQWRNSLETYAYPVLGKRQVRTIDTGMICEVFERVVPIDAERPEKGEGRFWDIKTETASRVRQRIEAVLNWASARGYRSRENPARWKGHLSNFFSEQRKLAAVKHHAALPYEEIASFIAALREQSGTGAKALEFLILTAARTSEVTGARWSEIDLDNKVWVIAGERMKAGREHRQPLSDPAVAILETLRADDADGFVFGGSDGREMSNMTMTAVLRRMGRKVTVHGFRSSFKTWASEATNHPTEVAEMALAHSVGTKIEAAYRRGDLLEKRRRLMDDWAAFCAAPSRTGAEIVSIRAARMASNEIG